MENLMQSTCFSAAFKSVAEYCELSAAIDRRRVPMGVLGVSHVHKAHIIHSLCAEKGCRAVVVMPDEGSANRMQSDLNTLGTKALLYPARDFNFSCAESRSREFEQQRLGVLSSAIRGDYTVILMSVQAAMQLILPRDILERRTLTVDMDSSIDLPKFTSDLLAAGYTRCESVEGKGQFAVRGGIIDVFSPVLDSPARIELWGDSVDSISLFDVETQRRTQTVKELTIIPAAEILYDSDESLAALISAHRDSVHGKGAQKVRASLNADLEKINSGVKIASPDRYFPLIYGDGETIFDYTKGAMLFVSESASVRSAANSSSALLHEDIKAFFEDGTLSRGLDRFALTFEELTRFYESRGAVYLDNLPRGSFDTPVKELINVSARQLNAWGGQLTDLLEDLRPAVKRGGTCIVFSGTEKAAKSLSEDIRDEGLDCLFFPIPPAEFPKNTVCVLPGSLSSGFEYPSSKLLVISYGMRQVQLRRSATRKPKKGAAFNSLDELHRGDYIVHSVHGIGIFDGITSLEASGMTKDYIKIRYAKDGVLYVPVTQLDLVSKYIGPSSDTQVIKLNTLGSGDWQKTRARVRTAVREMAAELIELYSKRMRLPGFAFSPDIDMQNDFERRFEFEETPDQLRCIQEIKEDMEKPHPMDRLLCGDVGFGKTEVALRAAFKCVADGKQCAILVPTTILALQHYQTLKKRFDTFPVESEMLSRFRSPKEQKEILKKLKRGSLDIIVGTHRLISSDIEFKDLGLVIVDEEQRFGVAQKERLKEKYPNIDVLTLSATPIPRTLNMAMTGIRDMSVIEEAPLDRHPVQTYVIEHDDEVIAQAIERELRRGGQVYYLHNRVEDIERTASKLHTLLPEARIVTGHGKMDEDELSEVWQKLLEGEIDVLVCTTIIETGVDVPNVNTLIIENADRMGLAQLHQIRGRVGRSARRASAYFTFTRGKELTEIATHRLNAIREFTEFGSGFKIAIRDLELRGAGNVLGAEQHGHMEAVGYDMYVKLLSEAVSEEKGEKPTEPVNECLIDLHVDAHIPESYISSVPQKLGMYRRIADIRCEEDAQDVMDELIDRFGDPPASVTGLVNVSLLRNSAASLGIYEIGQRGANLILYVEDVDMKKLSRLAASLRGRVTVNASSKPYISIKTTAADTPVEVLRQALKTMNAPD